MAAARWQWQRLHQQLAHQAPSWRYSVCNPTPTPTLTLTLTVTLRRLDPGFSRELLLRLCSKCAGSELCKGRRRAALLDACDAAATGAWAGSVTRPAEAESPLLFFARVTAALRMGCRFSVQRVLELRQADLAIT